MTTTTTTDLPAERPLFLRGLTVANAYPGHCRVCTVRIPEGAGHRCRRSDGRWEVQHRTLEDCRAAYATAQRMTDPGQTREVRFTPERGEVHVLPLDPGVSTAPGSVNGVAFYRVSYRQHGRTAAGWYLTRWTGREWVYAPRMQGRISAATRVGVEMAAAFGAAFHRCVFCTRDLDTAESITVGYGPTCAAQRGLPWGNVTAAAADLARQAVTAARPAPSGHARTSYRGTPADPYTCGRCGEECATTAEAADPAAHDCTALAATA